MRVEPGEARANHDDVAVAANFGHGVVLSPFAADRLSGGGAAAGNGAKQATPGSTATLWDVTPRSRP
jgi:hypothetical protein